MIADNVNGIVPGSQDGMTPDKADAVKENARTGKSSFDGMLTESIKQIEEKEIHFKKDLFSTVLPELAPLEIQAPDGKGAFRKALATVLKHEGSAYVSRDGGRGSSKFGILQSTARDFGYKGNIKNMSRAEAEAIYKKMWDRSGAASLPYPMSLVHFDTYVNSPVAARKLLSKAGDNAEKYLELRAQRYTRLAKLRPARYGRYLKGWMHRVSDLRGITTEYAIAKNRLNNMTPPAPVGPVDDRTVHGAQDIS